MKVHFVPQRFVAKDNSVGVVDSGFAGARLLFGRVTSDSLAPGLHWFSPVGGSLAIYDCRESRKDIQMNVYTKDVQSADSYRAVSTTEQVPCAFEEDMVFYCQLPK